MNSLRYVHLAQTDVLNRLSIPQAIQEMQKALKSLELPFTRQPLRAVHNFRQSPPFLLGTMPCYCPTLGVVGIKVISVLPNNADQKLPTHQGVVLLFSADSGTLLASVDADAITAIRTAAVSAVATDLLAREDAKVLSILGTGTQAYHHAQAISEVRTFHEIRIWGRNSEKAKSLAVKLSSHGHNATAFSCISDSTARSDVICTVTGSKDPILEDSMVSKGCHINAAGACLPTHRELSSTLVSKSALYADCMDALHHEAGDYLIPRQEGAIASSHAKGTLTQIMTGQVRGRRCGTDITIFKSLGLAIEDLYAAHYVYQSHRKESKS